MSNISSISIAIDPVTNINVLKVVMKDGNIVYKTRFSASMTDAQVFREILDSANRGIIGKATKRGGRIAFEATGENLIKIKTVLEVDTGRIVTSYPVLKESYMRALNYVDIRFFLGSKQ